MARVLPINVIEYLLCELNMEQFVQFHQLFPAGAPEEQLFIEKYKENSRTPYLYPDFCITNDILLGYKSELEARCEYYWAHVVGNIIQSTRKEQGIELAKLSTKVAQYVVKMEFYAGLERTTTIDQLLRFSNIQHIVCSTTQLDKAKKIFKFAKNCTFLQKIEFTAIKCNANLLKCLKEFLKYKADKNESVKLHFYRMHNPIDAQQNWILTLGKAIHGISGLIIDRKHIFPTDGQEWLRYYSQARHIDEIVIQDVKHVSTVLFDITKNAPSRNDDLAISKLSLENIRIELKTLNSLQHWRFGQIKNFCMYSVPLGYQGTLALAEHATFWPIVNKVELSACKLTTNGLLRLLPAMVHQNGCQYLEVFDVSYNRIKKSGLNHVGTFLRSSNTKNLKIFRMSRAIFQEDDSATLFIDSLRTTPFIEIDLETREINSSHYENILRAIFSKPNPQLTRLFVGNDSWNSNMLVELKKKYMNTNSKDN